MQFIKYGIILLNQAWPVEPTRLMGLRLQNMRDRRKDKGVRVCPEVKMSEVSFLEPLEDENKEKENDSDDDEQQKQPVEAAAS